MQAIDSSSIAALVAKYQGLSPRQRRRYNEAQTRNDFINPLFAALGWDMLNASREDVSVETHVSGGRADYAFKIDGVVRFYLEAKPLEDDLFKEDYAKQVITYAYNKGVTWAVLCNFRQLLVFNAEWETDDLARARVLSIGCDGYESPDSPLPLLSHESFLGNELEKTAQTFGGMRPRLPVEKSLFTQLRQWRERLFNTIARIRSDLTFEQIDEIIERLLNRLIFIRNSEDRQVEERVLAATLHQWRQARHKVDLTEGLRRVFTDFDKTFDSDLFAFHLVDQVLSGAGTQLEDILSDILAGLYAPPRSLAAYDFSVIDADVLGRVYEQYLGHVAQVTKVRAAERERQLSLGIEVTSIELEEKRQRRKQHGIYYTPKWVVDYIVNETLGHYLTNHTHDEVLNLKVLDPACGSGSFLIRAFDVLLNYHAGVKGKEATELDQDERLPLLTANIFGVDLDQRAVDIARLNLLLRAVARRELLPSLARNVVRGNSLISGPESELRPHFGDGWNEQHPFDWAEEFPTVTARGGFDIIIGNPPYVRIQTLDRQEVAYYNDHYEAATGNYDIYALFVEKALELLRPGGVMGYIVPNKFFQAAYGKGLRRLLSEASAVSKVVDFGDAQVFETGTTYTCLLFLQKKPQAEMIHVPAATAVKARPQAPNLLEAQGEATALDSAQLSSRAWTFPSFEAESPMRRLREVGTPLGEVADRIFQGIRTSANHIYVIDESQAAKLEPDLLRPLLRGEEIKRYARLAPTRHVLIPYYIRDDKADLIPANELQASYPQTWRYLQANRKALKDRERGRMRHEKWYAYVYPKNLTQFAYPKIVTPDIAPCASFSIDREGRHCFVSGYGILLRSGVGVRLEYVLALLNSRLLDFYLRRVSTRLRGGFYRYFTQFLAQLPIRLLDLNNTDEKKQHDDLVALAEAVLTLRERLALKAEVRDEERAEMERDIARTERDIDEQVYGLYGLTQDERRLVEEEVSV